MRKLAWLAIFLLIAVCVILALAFYVPGVSDTLGQFGAAAFGTLAGWIIGATTGALAWGSANFTQAMITIVTIYIVGAVSWLLIKKYLWDKVPYIHKKTPAVQPAFQTSPGYSSSPIAQTTPAPVAKATPTPVATPSPAPVVVEENKE